MREPATGSFSCILCYVRKPPAVSSFWRQRVYSKPFSGIRLTFLKQCFKFASGYLLFLKQQFCTLFQYRMVFLNNTSCLCITLIYDPPCFLCSLLILTNSFLLRLLSSYISHQIDNLQMKWILIQNQQAVLPLSQPQLHQ